jgi:hypothetical protein
MSKKENRTWPIESCIRLFFAGTDVADANPCSDSGTAAPHPSYSKFGRRREPSQYGSLANRNGRHYFAPELNKL